jgi:hypothetical protein
LGRDQALAELARRYFTGHGPATVHDFAWWSGLSLADARSGVTMVSHDLVSRDVAGRQYWASTIAPRTRPTSHAYLLPAFDEYTVAYRDRSALIGIADARHAGADDIFQPTIVVNGRVVGTWTRQIDQGSVAFGLKPFTRLGPTARRAVAAAARRYAAFLRLRTDAT